MKRSGMPGTETRRSVRIDEGGSSFISPSGNLYVLLLRGPSRRCSIWWARNRKCSVHPETGSLQVFEVQEAVLEADSGHQEEIPSRSKTSRRNSCSQMGIPEEVIPAVKVRSEEELDRLVESLPREAGTPSPCSISVFPDEILQISN